MGRLFWPSAARRNLRPRRQRPRRDDRQAYRSDGASDRLSPGDARSAASTVAATMHSPVSDGIVQLAQRRGARWLAVAARRL